MRKPDATSLSALMLMAEMANIDARRSPPDLNAYSGRLRPRLRFPQPKNTDNSPDRAKGMKPFNVEGVTIYAGSLKAARKKAALLQHQQNA